MIKTLLKGAVKAFLFVHYTAMAYELYKELKVIQAKLDHPLREVHLHTDSGVVTTPEGRIMPVPQ